MKNSKVSCLLLLLAFFSSMLAAEKKIELLS